MHILCHIPLQTWVDISAVRQESQSGVYTCHISSYFWVNVVSLHPESTRSPEIEKIQIKPHDLHWISLPVEIFTELDPQNRQEKSLHHFCWRLFKVPRACSSLKPLAVDITKGSHDRVLCIPSHSNGALCQCGGARDAHASVALGDYFSTAIVNHWDSAQHSSEYPTDAFGELQFAGSSKRHSNVGDLSAVLESFSMSVG